MSDKRAAQTNFDLNFNIYFYRKNNNYGLILSLTGGGFELILLLVLCLTGWSRKQIFIPIIIFFIRDMFNRKMTQNIFYTTPSVPIYLSILEVKTCPYLSVHLYNQNKIFHLIT